MIGLLIGLVIALLVVGLAYWVIVKLLAAVDPPAPPIVMTAIQIIFVLVVVAIALHFFLALSGVVMPRMW
jgi:hypothetical protein